MTTDAFDEALARAERKASIDRADVNRWAVGEVVLRPRDEGITYTVSHAHGDHFYSVHRTDGTPSGFDRYHGTWHAEQIASMFEPVPEAASIRNQVIDEALKAVDQASDEYQRTLWSRKPKSSFDLKESIKRALEALRTPA